MGSPSPSMEADLAGDENFLLERSEAIQIQGCDKRGRRIVRIVGKFFPARGIGDRAVIRYLERKIFPDLEGKPFVVVYIHTRVRRSENFPGVAALRWIHDALPDSILGGLHAVFFIHPGLQARFFLATVGRFLFRSGLYEKVRYVSRTEYLWEYVRTSEVELPEFVLEHDDELERRPLMDYGIESSERNYCSHEAPAMDSASSSMRSLRCIF